MLMLKTTHDRIVAAKDMEIAELNRKLSQANSDLIAETMVAEDRLQLIRKQHKAIYDLRKEAQQGEGWLQSTAWELRDAEKRIADLEARLAVFTTPRARNSRGRFISAKGASA